MEWPDRFEMSTFFTHLFSVSYTYPRYHGAGAKAMEWPDRFEMSNCYIVYLPKMSLLTRSFFQMFQQ